MGNISVVIPWFGSVNDLLASLESVREYFPEATCIVIDDNPEENTVIQSLKNIFYLYNGGNQGACYSRNRGVNAANTDYIIFLDAGDKFIASYDNVSIESSDLIYSKQMLSTGKIVNTHTKNPSRWLLSRVLSTTSGLIVKKATFIEAGGFRNISRSQEAELQLRLVNEYDVNVKFIDKILIYRDVDSARTSISTKTPVFDTLWLDIRAPYVKGFGDLIGIYLCFFDNVSRRMWNKDSRLIAVCIKTLLVALSPFNSILWRKMNH